MDQRIPLVAVVVILAVCAGYLYSNPIKETIEINNTIYPIDGLDVFYLYPLRCVNCDLMIEGQCDYCTSYYDERVMDLLSQQVGVPVDLKISDVVNKPSVFIVKNEKATLADARNRYTIANSLCKFANVESSCKMLESELERAVTCLEKRGIEKDSIIYHKSSVQCGECSKTDPMIDEMKKMEAQDGENYKVAILDQADPEDKKTLADCMDVYNNIQYVPQLICPTSGKDITGSFTLSKATDFADDCSG